MGAPIVGWLAEQMGYSVSSKKTSLACMYFIIMSA